MLWERDEIRRIDGTVRIDHAEISNHTDNVNTMLGSIRYGKLASDRVLFGPVFICHGLVDNGDVRRCGGVALCKITAAPNWNAQGLEISRADRIEQRVGMRLALNGRNVRNVDPAAILGITHGWPGR